MYLKYKEKTSNVDQPYRGRATDFGVDLPAAECVLIQPGEVVTVGTGIIFEFPLYGKIRRWITRLTLGVEVIGIGGMIWPRGRSNYDILAGVVDASYRGEIKVKIYNPLSYDIIILSGDYIAQLVPTLSLNLPLLRTQSVLSNTSRGASGGINQ